MENTLTHWTGVPVAIPVAAAEPTPVPASAPAPTGRTRRWSFEIGRDGLAICSTVEDHRPRIVAPVAERRPALAMTVAAVAGGFALLLVGASAGRAWSPAPPPADTAMIVPAAKPVPRPAAAVRAPVQRREAIGQSFPSAVPTPAASDDLVAIATIGRSEAITRALATGEFQEWTASDGTTGFAVAGPAETTPLGSCRALAVLTRKIDGSDSVASSRECRAPATSEPGKD